MVKTIFNARWLRRRDRAWPQVDFVAAPGRAPFWWFAAALGLVLVALGCREVAHLREQILSEAEHARPSPARPSERSAAAAAAAADADALLTPRQLETVRLGGRLATEARHPWGALLMAVEAAAPEGVRWLRLEHSSDRPELRLEGTAANVDQALHAVDALAVQPGWTAVVLTRLSADERLPGEALRFEVTARIGQRRRRGACVGRDKAMSAGIGLRRQWGRLTARLSATGPAGWASGLLLGTAAILWLGVVPHEERALAEARAAAGSARQTARASRASMAPRRADPAAAFIRWKAALPFAGDRQPRVAALFALAESSGLKLQQAELRYTSDTATGIARYRVSLPLAGSYAALRRFASAALSSDEALLLDGLRLSRASARAADLQAEFSFSLLMQAEASTPADGRQVQTVARVERR